MCICTITTHTRVGTRGVGPSALVSGGGGGGGDWGGGGALGTRAVRCRRRVAAILAAWEGGRGGNTAWGRLGSARATTAAGGGG
jgi:hypothetical protein